ncbi:MAG: VWA domain-containing protein [Pseudomonadales bacterium]|nr:VWA domain-containing protein [Pseudomonadales bacterium]
MNFDWPALFLLLPLPLLVYFLLPALKTSAASLYMPGLASHLLSNNNESAAQTSRLHILLMGLIWISLITAAAKPIRLGDAIELPASGRDLLLAVDISGSMEYADMIYQGRRVSRIAAVKSVLDDFLQKRQGDRVGLILYGSGAYIQAPLTFDLVTVQQLLSEAEIGFAGDGTAIGDAIGLSIKRLANNPADSRVVILLTDGQNSAGVVNPIEAAKVAKTENVKVYTVGVGHPSSRRYPIDEISLQKIAAITGGQYFRARNITELQKIYDVIDQLETLEQEPEKFRPQQSLFYWPLAAMLLSLFILLLDKQIQFSTLFNASRSPKKHGDQK